MSARVRLKSCPIATRCPSMTGTVVRQDYWDGYVIVRLDEPARYERADGQIDVLPEVRTGEDNLEPER